MVRNIADGDDNLEHLYTPIGGYMAGFLRNHSEVVFSIVSATLLIAYSYGMTSKEIEDLRDDIQEVKSIEKGDYDSLSNHINEIQKNGTGFSQAQKFILEQHGKEIVELKADSRQISQDLGEIKTDVRLISAWVRQQGGRTLLDGDIRDRASRAVDDDPP